MKPQNKNTDTIQQDAVYKTQKGTAVTDSLKVAETFGKQHKNVIQSIKNLTAENSAAKNWFYETTYTDQRGKKQPMFIMNRSGFSLLVMGFTGEKATNFKIQFIELFDKMEATIKQMGEYTMPQTFSEALRLAADKIDENARLQQKIEADAPRVQFSHAVEASKDTISIRQLAILIKQNGYDIGEKRLFVYLRRKGYLCNSGKNHNLPTQRAMRQGLFEVKKTAIQKADGETKIISTPRVTGKGQIFFINKFLTGQAEIIFEAELEENEDSIIIKTF